MKLTTKDQRLLSSFVVKRRSRGVALVAVLWIVSLLAFMAAITGSTSQISTHIGINAVENAKAKLLAEGGVNRAVFSLIRDGPRLSPRVNGALDMSFELDGDLVIVQVRDEDGKVDVNEASIELLAGLISAVDLDARHDEQSIAARIVDFRDEDSDTSPLGAERETYRAAGLARGPADRPLQNLEELRSVFGLDDALYERLRPNLTVFSNADGLDPLWASDAALSALPGMTPSLAAAIRANDDTADISQSLPKTSKEFVKDFILPARNLFFEIQAMARTKNGGHFLRESVIALDVGQDGLPFSTYVWRRGMLPSDDLLRRARAYAE